ncbi:hypothetical protein SISNIDRAFT_490881 [Sistotremastrum niveocremeum HHB9708]|uniref:Uncharacterized protein n=1 Tax=Sistotremastrum niveocremeum HHB9708 TaxID=1314777 RepID=A0A164NEZ6_9AGAM|nr:hypothetical protein SISNIDRAFT_490881 [Sistotremastrum niveocremeum HHB9708]
MDVVLSTSTELIASSLSEEQLIQILASKIEKRAYHIADESGSDNYERSQEYMESTLTRVRDTLNRRRALVNSTLNGRLYIDRIPNEILGKIFGHYVSLKEIDMKPKTTDVDGPSKWFQVLYVSKRWRQVALHNPTLFGRCHMAWDAADVALVLECRGLGLPLHLSIPPVLKRRPDGLHNHHAYAYFGEYSSPQAREPAMTFGTHAKDLHPIVARCASLHMTFEDELVRLHPNGLGLVGEQLRSLDVYSGIYSSNPEVATLALKKSRTLFAFFFKEPPAELTTLRLYSTEVPDDIVNLPNLKSVHLDHCRHTTGTISSTMHLLCKLPNLQGLNLSACSSLHDTRPGPGDTERAKCSFEELRVLSITKMWFPEITRIFSTITFLRIRQINLVDLVVFRLPEILAPAMPSPEDLSNTDFARFLRKGSELIVLLVDGGVNARLTARLLPTTTSSAAVDLAALFQVSFGHDRIMNLPMGAPEEEALPPDFAVFFDCLKLTPFRDLPKVTIAGNETDKKTLPSAATRGFLLACSSLQSITLKKCTIDNLEDILPAPLSCPSLAALTLDECSGTAYMLQDFLKRRKDGGCPIDTVELRNVELSPAEYDADLLRQYVSELVLVT